MPKLQAKVGALCNAVQAKRKRCRDWRSLLGGVTLEGRSLRSSWATRPHRHRPGREPIQSTLRAAGSNLPEFYGEKSEEMQAWRVGVEVPKLLGGWHLLSRSGIPKWMFVQIKTMCNGELEYERDVRCTPQPNSQRQFWASVYDGKQIASVCLFYLHIWITCLPLLVPVPYCIYTCYHLMVNIIQSPSWTGKLPIGIKTWCFHSVSPALTLRSRIEFPMKSCDGLWLFFWFFFKWPNSAMVKLPGIIQWVMIIPL